MQVRPATRAEVPREAPAQALAALRAPTVSQVRHHHRAPSPVSRCLHRPEAQVAGVGGQEDVLVEDGVAEAGASPVAVAPVLESPMGRSGDTVESHWSASSQLAAPCQASKRSSAR